MINKQHGLTYTTARAKYPESQKESMDIIITLFYHKQRKWGRTLLKKSTVMRLSRAAESIDQAPNELFELAILLYFSPITR